MLFFAGRALRANQINFRDVLDGSAARLQSQVKEFQQGTSAGVFLLNAKKHSSGLTLIAANHVFFMEPQ